MTGGPGTSDISVRCLAKDELPVWDSVVSSAPEGSIFHSSQWLSVLSRTWGMNYKIYGCFSGDDLIGGCPLYFYRLKGLLTIGTSIPPMTPYGGIVLLPPKGSARAHEQRRQDATGALIRHLHSDDYDSLHIVNAPEWHDIRCFVWEGWQANVLYTYYVDPASVTVSRNAKRNVKKGRMNGIIIQNSEDFDAFYRLFEGTFRNRGLTPPLQKSRFRILFETFHTLGRCELITAQNRDGEVISGDLYLFDDRRVYRWAAATSPESRTSGASFLLLSEAIEAFREKGYREMNLMTANIPYLAEFTQNFTPHLVPYYGVTKKSSYLKVSSAILGT